MKIYDCFTFCNEFDLLELRLRELYDHVDYFVLVEANKTFQNKDKDIIVYADKGIGNVDYFLIGSFL